MRIYILGGSGMLGHAFSKHFKSHELGLPGVTSPRINIENYLELYKDVCEFQPDVIINLAAICDMEKCEKYPASALLTHVLGAGNAALIASSLNIPYVYLSSACVFDGTLPAYYVEDKVNPISIYGKTKLMGEQIARSVNKHFVIRTEWCFGGGPEIDTKFIGKLYRQISEFKNINAVKDKFGSLSYLPDLCKAVEKLIQNESYGTYHVACKGFASRFTVAQEFVRLLGNPVIVYGVYSDFFDNDYFAPRPEREVLINSEIPGFESRHWQECLAEYSKEFRRDGGRNE